MTLPGQHKLIYYQRQPFLRAWGTVADQLALRLTLMFMLLEYYVPVSPILSPICISTSDCSTLSFSASASIALTLSFIASSS